MSFYKIWYKVSKGCAHEHIIKFREKVGAHQGDYGYRGISVLWANYKVDIEIPKEILKEFGFEYQLIDKEEFIK